VNLQKRYHRCWFDGEHKRKSMKRILKFYSDYFGAHCDRYQYVDISKYIHVDMDINNIAKKNSDIKRITCLKRITEKRISHGKYNHYINTKFMHRF
jgi:hypothetical protein